MAFAKAQSQLCLPRRARMHSLRYVTSDVKF